MGAIARGNSLQRIQYADAVATAYLGKDDTEDASKVVRDAVRTRPCMYTVRREAAEDTEKREIVDRRTYGHTCQSAHEWVCEQFRKTVRPAGIAHTHGRGGGRDGCGAKWLWPASNTHGTIR